MPRVKKAVIPVAGLGTRMLPASKAVPKELLPLIDKPALQLIIEELVESGIEDVILVNSPLKPTIKEHFLNEGKINDLLKAKKKEHLIESLTNLCARFNLKEVIQDEAKGLGHAVYCSQREVGKDPFIVVLPDDIIYSSVPATRQHLDVYSLTQQPVIALLNVPSSQTHLYGIAEGSVFEQDKLGANTFKITSLIEKPPQGSTKSTAAVIGRYVLTPKIFTFLAETKPGKGGEIQLTDALKQYIQKESLLGLFFEGTRYDIGDKAGFLKATIAFALKDERFNKELKTWIQELIK